MINGLKQNNRTEKKSVKTITIKSNCVVYNFIKYFLTQIIYELLRTIERIRIVFLKRFLDFSKKIDDLIIIKKKSKLVKVRNSSSNKKV